MELLIDGDIIAYKAASAAETPIDWGNGLWTLHSWEEQVRSYIDDFIEHLLDISELTTYSVALSDKDNFRKKVDPEYKANRKKTRKPMLLGFAREYLMNFKEGFSYPHIEADDILGIYGSSDTDIVIWSEDKDMGTIPCKQLRNDGTIEEVSKDDADFRFYTQVLTGDSVDNYGGCPKIGKVTAEKILKAAKEKGISYWEAVVDTYKKANLDEEYAIKQARLAHILQFGEYNIYTNKVVLWDPMIS